MIKQKRHIPNPNKMSDIEKSFLNNSNVTELIENNNRKDQYKGRMISMSDSFYKTLNDYLKLNPTEGNRSSFIVRVVAEYIENKH
jgi:hypothetical protein